MMLAGTVLTQMTLYQPASLTASGGEVLGESTFDHKIIPWQPIATSPARQHFSIDEGALHIVIEKAKGGTGERWDLQTVYKNLSFKAQHRYKVSFQVKASRDGVELCSAIYRSGDIYEEVFVLDGATGDMHMGPYMGGNWHLAPAIVNREYQTFEGIFTPTEDLSQAVWALEYAPGTEYYGNAVDGDELWFDNMSIECLDCDECNADPNAAYGMTNRARSGLAENYISVNQLGYFPDGVKNAVLSDNSGDLLFGAEKLTLTGSYDYEIVSTADDEVVYTGKTGKAQYDKDSDDHVCKIDFTEFTQPGEYYIRIKGKEWRSFPFSISAGIYSGEEQNLLTDALNYFYQNRSGMDLSQKFITSGEPNELIHAANRNESIGVVWDQWCFDQLTDAAHTLADRESRINAGGGWCSGTNYDKNMTEGGIAVWTLQNMYERAVQSAAGIEKFADGSGTVSVPESGNKYPDILDECRYELDFMAKMKVQPDEKTWGELAGLYYHKLQGVGFEALEKDYEHEFHSAYLVQPPTFAATLNYAACAAQGARLWAPYDKAYAESLMQSAKEAYAAFLQYYYQADVKTARNDRGAECYQEELNTASQYAPRGDVLYGDIEVTDDAYWAACELFISANALHDTEAAAAYLKELSEYDKAFQVQAKITGGDNRSPEGTQALFNWGCTASAGTLSLALHTELLTAAQKDTLEKSILGAADLYLETEAKQGYGTPYQYDESYSEPIGMSGLIPYSGYEFDSNSHALSDLIALAYAYDLTGESKYLGGVTTGMDYLLGNNPLSFSFITGYGSYCAENPKHRYWLNEAEPSLPKAPDGVIVSGPNAIWLDDYMYAIGFAPKLDSTASQRYYADSTETASANSCSLSANASLAWVASFLQDSHTDEVQTGDVTGDGTVDKNDVQALVNYLLCDGELAVPRAADLNRDAKLNAADLSLLKQMLLRK